MNIITIGEIMNLTIYDDIEFLKRAIEEAKKGVEINDGGPFGACIVDNETKELLACEHNKVIINNDPSAHAEIMAIRTACKKINNFDLSEGGKRRVTLYTTTYPCPMCMGAIMWSHINRVIFSGGANTANEIGFDDSKFYRQLNNNKFDFTLKQLLPEFNDELFNEYKKIKDTKTHY